ncbi:hypothetical protein [Hydrogenothermus marinus]|uniref:Uncharacterized protein n=1 Tax=Hydrogenothermus marinus TaxID=133270 RepID=A0A3M0BNR3_9AQUI|nr:hypothetical protein [Hydrogenothermus marinus]RMA96055.1 hypothetical protein CLV39_1066 [Hydrogenothermus marinus]
MEEERKAYPFALVGFFVSEKPIEEIFRKDVTPEELEKLQQLLKDTIFTEDVDIAIAPYVVPPDQVNDALNNLANIVFNPEEKMDA